ncbi:hypothetical protein SDC9_74692 [bioreactor metagenome]|uniref:Uncharacterized protein n=1 Tax=bioreactor metagenome TaxID=1076179 RepID=A0A644YNU3_9ZZZZ
MGPEKAAGVSGKRGEGNLKRQHLPRRGGVAGEMDRVFLVAKTAPAGK